MDSSPERRRHTRFQVGVPVTLTVNDRPGPVPAALTDISVGGCYFEAPREFKTGWQVSLTFLLEHTLCGATGAIVRAADRRGFGVEFANANEAFGEFIRRLGETPVGTRGTLAANISEAEIHVG